MRRAGLRKRRNLKSALRGSFYAIAAEPPISICGERRSKTNLSDWTSHQAHWQRSRHRACLSVLADQAAEALNGWFRAQGRIGLAAAFERAIRQNGRRVWTTVMAARYAGRRMLALAGASDSIDLLIRGQLRRPVGGPANRSDMVELLYCSTPVERILMSMPPGTIGRKAAAAVSTSRRRGMAAAGQPTAGAADPRHRRRRRAVPFDGACGGRAVRIRRPGGDPRLLWRRPQRRAGWPRGRLVVHQGRAGIAALG